MDDQKMATAFHEAGHAYLNHVMGYKTEVLEIHFGTARNRWEGKLEKQKTDVKHLSVPDYIRHLRAIAKVAIAGVLAQAKHLGCISTQHRVIFSSANDIDAWFAFFRDRTRTPESPGLLTVIMMPEGGEGNEVCVPICGSYFGTADSRGFNDCFDRDAEVDHQDLIRETIRLLDDPTGWSRIETLAESLYRHPADAGNERQQMDQDAILAILEDTSGE